MQDPPYLPAAERLTRLVPASERVEAAKDQASGTFPLLKVSPPIPVGRLAGRFKVQLWRASPEHKLNLIVGPGSQSDVVVMVDASHLGIYQGDEVLSVNDVSVQGFRHFTELLDSCGHSLEIQFYHKEPPIPTLVHEDDLLEMCCGPTFCVPQTMPVWCDYFYNPPEPRCRAESWTQREVLSASMAASVGGSVFRLEMHRTSMKQPFGLPLGVVSQPPEPSEPSNVASEDLLLTTPRGKRLCITESFYSDRDVWDTDSGHRLEEDEEESHYHLASLRGPVVVLQTVPLLSLFPGDELLRINGVEISDLCSCKAAMKSAIHLTLDFRRPEVVPRSLCGSEVSSPAMAMLIKTSRRSDDWNSASSTKDCSREAVSEESWYSSLFLKLSCNDVARQAADSSSAIEVQRSFDAHDVQEAVTI
ncbi:unnamed protein product [Symbiodinium natans]|uniref:PDZ domain-containing protein n=1 Tax=Symbiodinium natans TaxID=878477 RepID=A0A812IH03_9DINO|nr:unnamed protein product [Symbiodinium natans]